MIGKIGFEKLEINCIIGELNHERDKEQVIYVSLEVTTDFSKCVEYDSFKDTLDYVELSRNCIEVAKNGKFKLLETCGYEILKKIFTIPLVMKAKIRIEKPSAIHSAKFAFIELEM